MKGVEDMEKERQKLLYVILPNLVHKILRMSMLPFPKSKRKIEIVIEEIKKITNAECKSALEKFKD